MKFITESDLRSAYRKEGFSEFRLGQDCKLTPGARQFLTDRRVTLLGDVTPEQSASTQRVQTSGGRRGVDDAQVADSSTDWKKRKMENEIASLANSILLTAFELMDTDVCLSQQVAELEPHVSAMKAMLESDAELSVMECTPCSSITEENFASPLADCFYITAFHMQVPKAKAVLLLNSIRCAVHNLEVIFVETYHEHYNDGVRRQINRIRNRVSQLICTAFGGNECQRKE